VQPETPQDADARASWPSATAVIPTRDRPELLLRALRSIVAQDYPGHVELIVVFDGCEPTEIDLELPANRSLRVLTNSRTPGLAGNRNTGYLAATGDYVGSCDDDDEWMPTKLSAQIALLESRPDASICATGMLVTYNGEDIPRPAPAHDLTVQDFLRSRYAEVHSSALLMNRRVMLDEIGLFDEALPGSYGEDYEILIRGARRGPVVCVPDALTRVYFHDQSFFVSRWRTIDEALTYLLEKVPEFQDDREGLARILGQLAFANAAMGERKQAVAYARRSLSRDPRARHSYAALLVASGLVSADRVVAMARQRGRGI
jgi:glycosyltransferase involved in cell wall biosynthesis